MQASAPRKNFRFLIIVKYYCRIHAFCQPLFSKFITQCCYTFMNELVTLTNAILTFSKIIPFPRISIICSSILSFGPSISLYFSHIEFYFSLV